MHKYNLVQKLGTGTLGYTHLVVHKEEQVRYALKSVESKDATHANSIYEECLNVSKIKHPYIGKIHDLFIHFDAYKISFFVIIVSEYYEYNFQNYLDNIWSQNIEINYNFMSQTLVQLLEILSILQNDNLCHLNIKPSNICIIQNPPHIVLIDFGLLAILNDKNRFIKIKPDIYWCSSIFNYQVNPTKCDIWSIGIIMYSLMLTKVMDTSEIYNFIKSIDKFDTTKLRNLITDNSHPEMTDFIISMLDSNIDTGIDLPDLNRNYFYQKLFKLFSSNNVQQRQRTLITTATKPVPYEKGAAAVIDYINSEQKNENCVQKALIWFHRLTRLNIADKLPVNYTNIIVDALKFNNTNLTIVNCSIYSLTYLAMFCNNANHDLFNESTQALIIETANLHRDNIIINKRVASYFIVVSSFPQSSKIAGKIGAVQYLIGNLQLFRSPVILAPTLNALWNLCVEPSNCEIAIQNKSRDIILKIYSFSFESIEIMLHGSACLLAIIMSLDVSLNVDYVGLTFTLISALKYHTKNINLIKYICILLENLIQMNEEYGMQVLECTNNENDDVLYGLEVFKLIYEVHNDNSKVAHTLCRIIIKILSYPDLINSILIATQVEDIVLPIQFRFRNSETIFQSTQYILTKIDQNET